MKIERVPIPEEMVCKECGHSAAQHEIARTSHAATLSCRACERSELTVERGGFASPRTHAFSSHFRVGLQVVK